MRVKRNKKKLTKNQITFILITIILIITIVAICIKLNNDRSIELKQNALKQEILAHYNDIVITNKETNIYKLNNNKYSKAGIIKQNEELTLETIEISYKDEYLKVTTFEDEYYIYYKDIDKINKLKEQDKRYKKYIVFNENIVTKNTTKFYDKENNLVYTFNKSFDLPIIIKKKDLYGVEYNNRLLFIKKEDVLETKEKKNTEELNTKNIAVLNYHFFYDDSKAEDRKECNQSLCVSTKNFKSHLDYIKNNNIFTPTMEEFEMYMDEEIRLPKSTLITIDDGWRTGQGEKLLEEYQLNATIFLITSWFKEITWLNQFNYIEYHSHGDNLHTPGVCPGGQGGGIKCQNKTTLLKDLSLSRQKLGGSKTFCYPFYEYNDYSISVLKESGFTMAFIGGFTKATPNTDKYQIPRYPIYKTTTVDKIAKYIN